MPDPTDFPKDERHRTDTDPILSRIPKGYARTSTTAPLLIALGILWWLAK